MQQAIEHLKNEFSDCGKYALPFLMVLVRDADLISIETFLKIAPEDTNPVGASFNYPMTVGILLKPRSLLLGE